MNPDRQIDSSQIDDALVALHRRAKSDGPPSTLIERTVNAMNAVDVGRSKFNHRRRNWILATSGIAAVLIVGTLIAPIFFTQRASAAEMFDQVVKKNDAYKGWIHITSIADKPKTDQPDSRIVSTVHLNTIDGTRIHDRIFTNGVRRVLLRRPSTKEEMLYDSSRNQLALGEAHKKALGWLSRINDETAYTLKEMLDTFDYESGSKGVVVKEVQDGTWTLFEIRREPEMPDRYNLLKVWIDPSTKLIQQTAVQRLSSQSMRRFTYGGPDLHDLYDVNVPRDAKIVDNRITPDVRAVIDRIDSRRAKGVGPHTALQTKFTYESNGEPGRTGTITILGKVGENTLINRYFVRGRPEPKFLGPLRRAIYQLDDWPDPDLAETVERLKAAHPEFYSIMIDGKSGWCGFQNDLLGEPSYQVVEFPRTDFMNFSFGDGTVPDLIWPIATNQFLTGANKKIVLEAVQDHPNWIAIVVDEDRTLQESPLSSKVRVVRSLTRLVIDPTRNDVPVSYSSHLFYADAPEPIEKHEVAFEEYAQLPDGTWYPTLWKEHFSGRSDPTDIFDYVSAIRLKIQPGQVLDASWFRNYADDPPATQSTQK